ncbi:MAG: sporulation protein [Acidimicrobiales bacterium]
MNAIVTITGDLDRKVRAVKVQLVRTALHRYTSVDVLDHGSHNTLLHEEVVITEMPITSPDGKVVQGSHAVSLRVPEDGLPSATDQVKWSVRAIIDRRHGVDVKAEAPVEVLAGPERFASEATAEARYKGERYLDLELSNRTLRPGETITGNVVIRPTRPMTVTKVAVTFVLTISVKKGLEGTAVVPQILLDEPLDVQAGDTKNLPFDLTLPDDAAPTVRGGMTTPPCHSIISYDVGAEAEASLSADDKTGTEGFVYLGVNVYNTDVAPAGQA